MNHEGDKMTVKNNSRLLIAFCVCLMIFFLILNIYTPLTADDYSYSNGIDSISDIFISQYNHYFNWGGRSVALFLTQFWLLAGKIYFNFANTIIYCFFIILVQFHITGKLKINPVIFIFLNIFFWYSVPVWGQNFLWLTGSCVYLWTTVIILFFLLPYRKKIDNTNYKIGIIPSILFLFTGILSGWSNENSGAAVLFFFLALFTLKIVNKRSFSLFEITGFIGFLIGYIMLTAAPGNYARLDVINQLYDKNDKFSVSFFIERFLFITRMIWDNLYLIIIFIPGIIICILYKKIKIKINLTSILFTLAFLAAAYSMILSPAFPQRAFFIVIVFVIIIMGNIFIINNVKLPDFKIKNILIAIFLLIVSLSIIDSSRKILGVYLR